MLTRKTINVRINDFNLIEILYFKNHILNSNNRGLKMYYFFTLKHSTHWKISNKTQFYLAFKLTFVQFDRRKKLLFVLNKP